MLLGRSIATLLAAGLLLPIPVSPEPSPARDFLRGVVVSCPKWGPIWGSPEMARSLAELKSLGVEWVAIHPYGWLRKSGEVRFRPARELDFLDRAVELAATAGLRLFWKPHLGYWGSFDWRGDIAFGTDSEAWRRFFDGYRAFIVDQASFAESAGVEILAVGVEYERTTAHESDWRRIIGAVREVYRGKITYVANWDSLEKVPFWDAVDLIGVHAYFPLTAEANPERQEVKRGWQHHLARLRELSAKHNGKRILFAEIGYNRSSEAARQPWSPVIEDRPATRELRRRLMEVALERIEAEPTIAGMFWWKWIPGPSHYDRDFSMRDPEARAALSHYWGRSGAESPEEREIITTPE